MKYKSKMPDFLSSVFLSTIAFSMATAAAEVTDATTDEATNAESSIATIPTDPERPKLIKQVTPMYPRAAQRRSVEGKITLKISIDDAGKVIDVEVLESDRPGVFDKAAITAAEKWEFEPGKPTNDFTQILNFQLTS